MISILSAAWRWYAHSAGILLVAAGIAYAMLVAFAHDGPVVELITPPSEQTLTVPYKGELAFRLSVQRNASCPGVVVHRLLSRNGGAPESITTTIPIISTDIRASIDATVRFVLPASVYPGRWLYQYVVDSRCPTFQRQDQLAAFEIEVTP